MDEMRTAMRGRWAVAAMFLVNGFLMGAWAAQIPRLMPRHAILEGMVGLIILALGIGAVSAMLLAGRLIGRFGSRRMVVVFGLLSAATFPLLILAPSLWLVFPLAAIMGGVTGTMDVSMNANSVAVERRLGRAIMSSSHGFWSLGGFAGGALGALAIARFGAAEQALVVGGISALVVGIAGGAMMYDPPHAPDPATDPATGKRRGQTFPRKPLLYLIGAMALFTMVPEGAVLDWAAIFMQKDLGTSLAMAGFGYAAFSMMMAGMRFAGDRVRDRFGAVRTLQISGLAGALGMALAAGAPNGWVAIAGFAISGLGVANMVPILFSAAGNMPGLSPGAGIATVTMMGYSGILVAPSTIGFVAQSAGFRLTFAVLAVILLVVVALAGKAEAADRIRPGS